MSNQKSPHRFKLIHLFLIVIAVNVLIAGYYRWTFSKPFNRSLWLSSINDIDKPTTRKRMLKDIRRNVLRIGMTENEIIETLGDSDSDEYFRGYDFVYWIGPDSSYIDSEWLVLKLDEDGKLHLTDIVTD